jgi:hypothetical protein
MRVRYAAKKVVEDILRQIEVPWWQISFLTVREAVLPSSFLFGTLKGQWSLSPSLGWRKLKPSIGQEKNIDSNPQEACGRFERLKRSLKSGRSWKTVSASSGGSAVQLQERS